MIRVIGIDFGTSSTYMFVKRYNPDNLMEDSFNYIAVSFEHGESVGYLASVIRENSDGSFDFGRTAIEELEDSEIHRNFKMNLESSDRAEREKAMLLTEKLFAYLYKTYQQQLNQMGDPSDTVETVISYPVKWQENTVNFMLEAAKKAGFPNIRGMDEATAAISTVISQNFNKLSESELLSPDKKNYLLLVDMGAGTTDLVLCKYYFENTGSKEISADQIKMEFVMNWPTGENDPTFGGREIDEVLTEYVEEYLERALPEAISSMASAIARMGNNVKLWKENLVSPSLNKDQPISSCGFIRAYLAAAKEKFPAITRESFEALISDQLNDYTDLIRGCLDAAAEKDKEFAENGLNMVILTGGHSAWYFARDIIDGTDSTRLQHPTLSKIHENKSRVFSMPNPQSTVALGLIYNRMMSSIILKQAPVADTNWVKYLYGQHVYPTASAADNSFVSDIGRTIYQEAERFTRHSMTFNVPPDLERAISICHSCEMVDNIFRFRKSFKDKEKDICFCVGDPTSGVAVTVNGFYFDSFFVAGTFVPWTSLLHCDFTLTPQKNNKVRIFIKDKGYYESLTLPPRLRVMTYTYLKMMLDHLRRTFPKY